jgi:uncharacterized membrane protein
VIPLAAEAWQAVLFAGLIPVVGLGGAGYLLYRAARDDEDAGGE